MSQNNHYNKKKSPSLIFGAFCITVMLICIALSNSYFMQYQYLRSFCIYSIIFLTTVLMLTENFSTLDIEMTLLQNIKSKRTFHVRVLTIIRSTSKGTIFI